MGGWSGKSKDALVRMDWYPQDYLSDTKTAVMTLEEHGAYMLLLWRSWLDGPMPNDHDMLARVLRVSRPKFDRLWAEIGGCFEERDGHYESPRLERERTAALRVRREKQRGARIANAKRDAKRPQKDQSCERQQQQQQQQQHSIPPPPSGSASLSPEALASLWAEHCPTLTQPDKPLADGVREALVKAIKRQKKRDWAKTFARVGASPKLRGEVYEWRCPGILWAVGPKNLAALDAGQHDPQATSTTNGARPRFGRIAESDAALEEFKRQCRAEEATEKEPTPW